MVISLVDSTITQTGPHNDHGAVAGDWQIFYSADHASTAANQGVSGTGWTLLSRTTTLHSALSIWTRQVTSDNDGETIQNNGAAAVRSTMLRTYRGADGLELLGTGSGLTAPGRNVSGLLVRAWANAISNSSVAPGNKNLNAPAGLSGVTTKVPWWTWYEGLMAGDDTTPSGQAAPARTAIESGDTTYTRYPQYADIMLTSVPDVPKLYLGNTQVDKLYLGNTNITSAYLGNTSI